MEHEKVYSVILEKIRLHVEQNGNFSDCHEIDDLLSDIIHQDNENLGPIFDNNVEIKPEDNIMWIMDGIKLRVMMGTYGEFAYDQTLRKLYVDFGFSK
jgi:hypothetical protein